MAADKDGNKKLTRGEKQIKRLLEAEGKRMPVDLDKERLQKLEELEKAGYAGSKAGVIRKAIDEVHATHVADKKG